MNCKVKQGCLTSESCCILLWLAFTLFPVSVVTAADNRKRRACYWSYRIGKWNAERGYNRCGRYIHYTVGKERIIDHFICWVPEENGSGKR